MTRKQKTRPTAESKWAFPKLRPDAEELMKTISSLSREEIFEIRAQLAGKGIASEEKSLVDWLGDASAGGDAEMVEKLLKQGVDVNGFNKSGCTALFMAADSADNAEVIGLLLKNGADPNIGDYGSRLTPLHAAAYYGDAESVKLLLEAGADPNAVNNKGETPLMLAAIGLGTEVAEFLMDGGIGQTDRLQIGRSDNVTLMGILIENGAKLQIPKPEIHTLGDLMDLMKQSPGISDFILRVKS